MSDAKPANVPLEGHFKLSKAQAPTTKNEKTLMSEMPYASVAGSLMHYMVYTRLDIAQAVRVVSKYMSNPENVLESNKVDLAISERKFRYGIVV